MIGVSNKRLLWVDLVTPNSWGSVLFVKRYCHKIRTGEVDYLAHYK